MGSEPLSHLEQTRLIVLSPVFCQHLLFSPNFSFGLDCGGEGKEKAGDIVNRCFKKIQGSLGRSTIVKWNGPRRGSGVTFSELFYLSEPDFLICKSGNISSLYMVVRIN